MFKKKRDGLLAGDEANELRQALLHDLLGILGNLSVRGEGLFHDPANIGDREKPVLLSYVRFRAVLAVLAAPVSGAGHRRKPRTAATASPAGEQ